jgi:adenylosuccinate synthase
MILHPLAMLAEERHLRSVGVTDAFSRLSIDREALVITPFQQSANRLKEMARGDGRHGSCGLGIGETMSDWIQHGAGVLFAGDLADRGTVVKKLRFLRDVKIAQLESLRNHLPQTDPIEAEWKVFADPEALDLTADLYQRYASLVNIVRPEYLGKILDRPGVVVFEGAQGVLLDEWYGFYPYNTWSRLTYKNADTLLSENGYAGSSLRYGLTRGYATRHGAGPFVTEDRHLTAQIQDIHNENNPWQRTFRVGYLDLVGLRYALKVIGKVDGLVITNLDRMEAMPQWKICNSYRYTGAKPGISEYFACEDQRVDGINVPADPTNLGKQEELTRLLLEMRPVYTGADRQREAFVDQIGRMLGLPVAVTSHGPTAREKFMYNSTAAIGGPPGGSQIAAARP